MMIDAIVFDLDGTLARFNLDYKSVRVEVRNYLIKMGVPAPTLSTDESIFEMIRKAQTFVKNQGRSEKISEELAEEAVAIADKHELKAAGSTSMLPGVEETLLALKERRLKIGIFTINSEKSTEHILKKFKIRSFFDTVVPRDFVKNVKPSSEHLQAALKDLAMSPSEVVVVGDGVNDIECAKSLNVIAVGLPTGLSSCKELINSGADYVITSITDLPVLVDELNKISKP